MRKKIIFLLAAFWLGISFFISPVFFGEGGAEIVGAVKAAALDDLAVGKVIQITGENGAAYKFVKLTPRDDDGNIMANSDGTNGSYWMLADNYCGLNGRPLNCMGKDTSGNNVPSVFQFWAETNADGNNSWSQMVTNTNAVYLRALMPFYNDLPDIIGGFDKDEMILTKNYPMASIRSDGGDTTTYKYNCLLSAGTAIAITGDTLAAADVANCVWPDKVSLPSYTDWQDGLNRYNVFAGATSAANAYTQARFGKPWNDKVDDNGFTWKPWTRSANGWAAPNGREVWQIHGAQPDYAVHGEPAVSSFGVSPVLWLASTLVTTGGSGTYTDPYAIDDKTPPTVVNFTPTGEYEPLNPTLEITFSEKIGTMGKVMLNGVEVTSGSWSDSGQTIFTIIPGQLEYATRYQVQISGFKDTTGNQMAAASYSFLTIMDTSRPTVTEFEPQDPTGTTGVPISGTAKIKFSKPMNIGAIGEVIFEYGVGADDEQIVTLSEGKFADPYTFEAPYWGLKPFDVFYQVTIKGFRDAAVDPHDASFAGNEMEENNDYNFFTEMGDWTVPTITNFSPSGEGVSLEGEMVMSWSSTMKVGAGAESGLWQIKLNGEDLAATAGAWINGETVYKLDYAGLEYGTTYTVTVGGFKNWSGTIMIPQEFSFKTIEAPKAPGGGGGGAPIGFSGGPISWDSGVCAMAAPASAPTLTGAYRTGPDQATLFWTVGDGEATGWLVNYGIEGKAMEYGTKLDGGDLRSAKINGLDAKTNYTFELMQVHGCAPSPRSNQLPISLQITPIDGGKAGGGSGGGSGSSGGGVGGNNENRNSSNVSGSSSENIQASNRNINSAARTNTAGNSLSTATSSDSSSQNNNSESTATGENQSGAINSAEATSGQNQPKNGAGEKVSEQELPESGRNNRRWLAVGGLTVLLVVIFWLIIAAILTQGKILINPGQNQKVYVYKLDGNKRQTPQLIYYAEKITEEKTLRVKYGQYLVLNHRLNPGKIGAEKRVTISSEKKSADINLV